MIIQSIAHSTANGQPGTDVALLFARNAVRKLLAGEPLAPHALTSGLLGPYLDLMSDWQTLYHEVSGSAENEAQVIKAMHDYWLMQRLEVRYIQLVQAVDAEEVADLQADVSAARAEEIIREYTKRRQPGQRLNDAQRRELWQSLSVMLGVGLEALRQYGVGDPTFELIALGTPVSLGGIEGLHSLTIFCRKVAAVTGEFVKCSKKEWLGYAQILLDLAERVEVGPESDTLGLLRSYLVRYLDTPSQRVVRAYEHMRIGGKQHPRRDREFAVSDRQVIIMHKLKGVCLRRHDFHRWLAEQVHTLGREAQQILEKLPTNLRRLGCEPEKMTIEVERGAKTSVSLYRVPKDILDETSRDWVEERRVLFEQESNQEPN